MDEFKTMLASRTVWAGLLALAAGVLSVFGYSLSPDDQARLTELLAGVGASVGGIGAIVYRIRATKRIAKPTPPDGTLKVLAAIFLLGGLVGCASPGGIDRDAPPAATDGPPTTVSQDIADKFVRTDGSPEQRTLRLCLAFTMVGELLVHRISTIDFDDRDKAMTTVARMRSTVAEAREGSRWWLNTDVSLAVIQLADVVGTGVSTTGRSLVSRSIAAVAAPTPSIISSVLGRVRQIAEQSLIGQALMVDVVTMMDAINATPPALTSAQGWTECEGRLDRHHRRLAALVGISR